MEFKGTKGNWKIRNQSIQGNFDIISENEKNWFASVHSLGTISNEESASNAKLIEQAPRMLKTLIDTYLELQKLSNKTISNAIETDFLRANLRNTICHALDVDCEAFQNYIETKALK